jgi:hypothetical protein
VGRGNDKSGGIGARIRDAWIFWARDTRRVTFLTEVPDLILVDPVTRRAIIRLPGGEEIVGADVRDAIDRAIAAARRYGACNSTVANGHQAPTRVPSRDSRHAWP